MKIKIELDESLVEDEILIRCSSLTPEIQDIQKTLSDLVTAKQKFTFYKQDTEYYLPLDAILFFETEGNSINVHTSDDVYQTHYKLYELEELLPGNFMRISKSAILNIRQIYSITRSISSVNTVQFQGSHKQVNVSRNYIKPLKFKLEEKRSHL